MSAEQNILDKAGRDTGFKVPDGYFDQLYAAMPDKLPERTPAPEVKLSTWQRLKPYVYLAAMFAGIWCMMQMFHMMSSTDVSLEAPPADVMAALSQQPESFEEMIPDYGITDFELEQEISEDYSSIEELSEDLGVTLEPQYEAMNVGPAILAASQPEVAQNKPKK